jgi:hypothetical protein
MGLPEMQDCRGIILERYLERYVIGIQKFFNAEGNAHKIDWKTAKILEKLDGTMIQLGLVCTNLVCRHYWYR